MKIPIQYFRKIGPTEVVSSGTLVREGNDLYVVEILNAD